jgi:hypothetical protein
LQFAGITDGGERGEGDHVLSNAEVETLLTRRAEIGRLLESRFGILPSIPQMLASGNAGVSKNMSLFLHSLWMMVSPPRLLNLAMVCSNVVGFTTDMGTELGLADFAATSLRSVLPAWVMPSQDAGLQADFGFVIDEEVGDNENVTARPVFPLGMVIAGNLHVIHNLTWFSDTKLSKFDWFLEGLKQVVTLLHYRYHREHFLHTCVLNSPYRGSAELFRVGVPLVTEWRWGSVVYILEKVLPLKFVLRHTFNPSVFNSGRSSAGEAPESGAPHDKSKQGLLLLPSRRKLFGLVDIKASFVDFQ